MTPYLRVDDGSGRSDWIWDEFGDIFESRADSMAGCIGYEQLHEWMVLFAERRVTAGCGGTEDGCALFFGNANGGSTSTHWSVLGDSCM